MVNRKLQAPKDYRKSIRLEMYYCQKYGVNEHLKRRPKTVSQTNAFDFCRSMLGKINYCLQFNPKDTELQKYREYLIEEIRNLQ